MPTIGIGASGAGAAQGVNDAIMQIMAERRAQAMLAEQQKQSEMERQIQLQNQQRLTQDATARQQELADNAAAKQAGVTQKATDEARIQKDFDLMDLSPSERATVDATRRDPTTVTTLQAMGKLAPKPSAAPKSPGTEFDQYGEAARGLVRQKYNVPKDQPLPPEYEREALHMANQNMVADKTPPEQGGGATTPDQIERFTHFDPVNGNTPAKGAAGLTPNGILQDSIQTALTGSRPASLAGLSGKGAIDQRRTLIDNVVGALATKAGTDVATLRSAYRGLDAANRTMATRAATTNQAAEQASTYLGLAADAMAKLPRTGSPLVNKYLQYAQRDIIGDPSLSSAEQFIYAASREYAKVASGSSGSVQGLTDRASAQVDKLLSVAQNPGQFRAVVNGMLKDMAGAQQAQIDTLYGLNQTIGNFFSAVTGVAPSGQAGRAAPVGQPQFSGQTPGGVTAPSMRFDAQGRLVGGP